MEYKPFTTKQKNVIREVAGIVSSWRNSNDISSPTMYSDIWEELSRVGMEHDIPESQLEDIEKILGKLLTVIQHVDQNIENTESN